MRIRLFFSVNIVDFSKNSNIRFSIVTAILRYLSTWDSTLTKNIQITDASRVTKIGNLKFMAHKRGLPHMHQNCLK